MSRSTSASGTLAKFGYFVLQARSADNRGVLELSGVLENLATGEKQVFASADELTRLLRAWSEYGRDGGR